MNKLIQCSNGKWYVIPADEEVVFWRWCLALEGKRRLPRFFKPIEVEGPTSIVFKEWKKE